MSFLKSLFSPKMQRATVIDHIIRRLADEGSIIGMAVREISYRDVLEYMQGRECRIINQVNKGDHYWIEFEVWIGGNNFVVCLGKTFEGDGSVLTARWGDI